MVFVDYLVVVVIKLLIVILAFIGCSNVDQITIFNNKKVCKCPRDSVATLYYQDKRYKCSCTPLSKKQIKIVPHRTSKECKTKYTKVYNTPASGKITICVGALLKKGEKSILVK